MRFLKYTCKVLTQVDVLFSTCPVEKVLEALQTYDYGCTRPGCFPLLNTYEKSLHCIPLPVIFWEVYNFAFYVFEDEAKFEF